MIAKSILMFGKPCLLLCDANCRKAWGINNREKVYLSSDENDYAYRADGELGEAPEDPGTYEGGHGKPTAPEERLNKWCARECERSVVVDDGKPAESFDLPDLSKRFYNFAPHTRP